MTLINRSAADKKVRVTDDDSTSGTLVEKVVAGPGVLLTVITDGATGEQQLVVTANDPDAIGFHKIRWRTINGCKVPVYKIPLVNHKFCFIKKVVC